ncbi:MAG TPA: SIR2 family protein [Candidatus Angelobacter sp.]
MTLIAHPDLVEVQRELCSANKPVVFFVGAGLSKGLGYPLWHELLRELIHYGSQVERLTDKDVQEAEELVGRGDYLTCGSLLRDHLQSRVEARLWERFSPDTLPQVLGPYEKLVRLPCAGFVTTNYDAALETAYSKIQKKPLMTFLSKDERALGAITQSTPFLLKLHGDATRRSFVLSSSDYEELLQNASLQRFLYSIFFSYKIVFLGYGLSDNDILIPLKQLTRDFYGGSRRHVAIVPEGKYLKTQRDLLENQACVNIVSYPLSADHHSVDSIIMNWVLATEEANNKEFALNGAENCTDLLKRHGAIIIPYLRNTALRLYEWLVALPNRWGPSPGSGPRAANIAEGLLAMSAAARVIGIRFEHKDLLSQLLSFSDLSGSFISKSLGTAQVQTHSLSMFALSKYAFGNADLMTASHKAGDWLLRNTAADELGWGRFGQSSAARSIPSCWAFAALLSVKRFPESTWKKFRQALLQAKALDYVVGEKGKSCTSAAWLLWLLSQIRSAGYWSTDEENLMHLALSQLSDPKMLYLDEVERYQIEGDGAGVRHGIWVSWTHASAPAVILGCLPWINEDPERTWFSLGKAIATVMQQASEGGDGHLKDATLEREGTPPLVFQSLYGLWALSECIEVVTARASL